jgi:Phosphatidylserine/phosphatidylglycerophosphate/cardiolipin synthases and related enzymes
MRIIVSPAFRTVGKEDNWELTMESLDKFDLKGCLRGMNLRFYTHLHNKGVVIDRKRVVVSSTNWSENSIARAREAGVPIECPEVASYFADVFDFDWSIALPIWELPANFPWAPQAAQTPVGVVPIHPADLV